MRLLLISNLFPPKVLGGYEIAAHDLAQGLAERGHTVRVLTSSPSGDLAVSDAETETAASRAGVDVRRELRLTAYGPATEVTRAEALTLHFEHMISQPVNSHRLLVTLREFQPDAVMVFNLIGVGAIGLLDVLRHSGVPFTLNLGDAVPAHVLGELPRAVHDVYAKPGVAAADYFADIPFVAVSSKLVGEIARFGVQMSGDRLVVPRGIRLPGPTPRRASITPEASPRTFRFVFASVLFAHKGIDLVLDAAAALLREATQAPGDFTVDVFGAGDDDFYHSKAEQLGLGDVVRFHGNVERAVIYEALVASDAFLFPTAEREPLGQAPLQAAILGCMPIVTAQAGISEWLSNEAHCLKIDRTAESLTDAMRAVVSGEVDSDAIGRRAQRFLSENYSFDAYIDAVFEFGTRPRAAGATATAAPALAIADETNGLDAHAGADLDADLELGIDARDEQARRVLSAWLAETQGVSDDLVVPRRSSEWPD